MLFCWGSFADLFIFRCVSCALVCDSVLNCIDSYFFVLGSYWRMCPLEYIFTATGGHHVVRSGIRKTRWSLIAHLWTANCMHAFKVMVVCSSSSNSALYSPLSRPLKLHEKGGGVGWKNGYIQYLRWANLCQKHHLHCYWDTTQKKHLDYGEAHKQRRLPLQVCHIGPTWALSCVWIQ